MNTWGAIAFSVPAIPSAYEQSAKLLLVVSAVMRADIIEICGDGRAGRQAAFARQIMMYLCRRVLTMSVEELAESFGRDPSTVRHAVRRIEMARGDPEVDRTLRWLEATIQEAGHA